MDHVVKEWNDDQTYGVDQLGVRIMYGNPPSLLKVPTTIPGNTHTINPIAGGQYGTNQRLLHI